MITPAETLETYIQVATRIFEECSLLTSVYEERPGEKQTQKYVVVKTKQLIEYANQWLRSFDEVDLAVFEGPSQVRRRLRLWSFERDLRFQMVQVIAALQGLRESAEAATEGTEATVLTQGYDGETLQQVAARTRGDWRTWREVVDANDGLSIGQTVGGKVIVVPPEV